MNLARQQDFSRLGERLKSGGDVHAIAIEVLAVDDDVAKIDADAQNDALVRRHAGIGFRHRPLHGGATGDGLNGADKFDQQPVAHDLDDTPAVTRSLAVDDLLATILQQRQGAGIVALHEPAEADNVGRQDGHQAPLNRSVGHETQIAAVDYAGL
jgi:hypothetical protein